MEVLLSDTPAPIRAVEVRPGEYRVEFDDGVAEALGFNEDLDLRLFTSVGGKAAATAYVNTLLAQLVRLGRGA
jgi:hypothetical protein